MRDIDAIVRRGTGTGDNMNGMMKDSIRQIKVISLFPVVPLSLKVIQNTHPDLGNRNRNIGGCHGLSGILDSIIGTTSTTKQVMQSQFHLFIHLLRVYPVC